MDISVSAKKLIGSITPPPFKSEVTRTLILGALCGMHPSSILESNIRYCDDITAAKAAVEKAFFDKDRDNSPIPAGASAALIRMLAPILLFLRGKAVFSCEPSLLRRGMNELHDALCCDIVPDHAESIIRFSGGRLDENMYTVSAAKSSQFASGMLIAAALKGFELRIESPVSLPYLRLTIDCLERFGCKTLFDPAGFWRVLGRISAPNSFVFQPDMSYAANFIAADLIGGGDISVIGAERGSKQADARALEYFQANDTDITDSPDLFPILCVYALKKDADTVLRGIGRLRGKESDRIESSKALITALGGKMDAYSDHAIIRGCGGRLLGGAVQGFGDHRIVMAAAVASLMCAQPVVIRGAEAVSKSAPQFFNDFRSLGGKADELIR